MTNAIIGHGLVYAIEDSPAGTGTFTNVAEVIDLTPPNTMTDDVDATHFESPNKFREYIPGLIEPGDCSFRINWIPNDTTGARLMALRTSGEVLQHQVTWPNGVTWTFSAYVKGFEPDTPIDGRMTATVTCKVSGSVVEAPAA